eukprot:CAMPEP_0185901308 /NCGR_PEP_ID=MMETSP0196C-20130402/673_1 /TAXON_ID=2932 /ORGANISM="Alexandrium fundyense, Strain CCMP1719" /LENGTH=43 /DNA_ID= /DNA_START= /DNA_END= /DNA_ORIENTATION=
MAAAVKSEVDALVAKIGDKKEGQSSLEGLAKLAEERGAAAQPF